VLYILLNQKYYFSCLKTNTSVFPSQCFWHMGKVKAETIESTKPLFFLYDDEMVEAEDQSLYSSLADTSYIY
jgi:hypothetical protein